MTDQIRQARSALMDGELDEQEIDLLLQQSDDEELRSTWVRYHAARSAMQAPEAIGGLEVDISAQVREAAGCE